MEMFEDDEQELQALMTPMHQIETNIFLGNLQAAKDENLLRAHNITSIVQCIENSSFLPKHDFIEYAFVPIHDMESASLLPHLSGALHFIHRMLSEGRTVLIHCAAGISRSSSVTISYMMATKGMNFDQAKAYVKSKRRCISPNPGFEQQLRSLSLRTLQSYLE